MLLFIVFLLLIIIIAPALEIIPQSFTALNYFIYPIKAFSLKWYDKFFANEQWLTSLERSPLPRSTTSSTLSKPFP